MIKYGLMLSCLIASSSLSAMEVREDLQNKPHAELKQSWDAVIKARDAFYEKHGKAWRNNPVLEQELDNLNNENQALMNAVMFGDLPRHLIKPHGISSRPVVEPSSDNNNNHASEAVVEKKEKPQTFEEIFANAVVKKTAKKKIDSEDPSLSKKQKLEQKNLELESQWNALCASGQGKKGKSLADIAAQMDDIEDQRIVITDQLGLLKGQK